MPVIKNSLAESVTMDVHVHVDSLLVHYNDYALDNMYIVKENFTLSGPLAICSHQKDFL